ncbi:T9SS type A sorting domain-containing protein [uncultured Psychroserpens sp.]|uniref:T9SS type A sorting domain-containing protein n=1 Tax=uncultured Psychroserpens sp. TaxID=255436 RepID=UPI0026396E4A|nr:T9SS type A sorting domain-containing protein [uncultured Psychroserpens sp.]
MKKITLWLLCCCMVTTLSFSQTFPGSTGAIPDATCDLTNEFALDLSAESIGTLGSGNNLNSVSLDITHTWASDLDITLVAPDGTEVELSTDNGSSDDNYTGTVFADGGADGPITGGVAPFTGTYSPEGSLLDFDGVAADGVWILRVCDDASGDTGTLDAWALTFGPPPPPSNDDCLSATALTCFDSASGSTDTGTDTDGNGDVDVWFSFDSSLTTAGDTVTFSLCGSGFDTIITVYDSCGGLVVDGNDDSCGLQSEVSITSDGATNYLIAVEGFNGATGSFDLAVICPSLYPSTEATLTLDGCVDSDTYSVAYDGTTQGVVWVELVYDGNCTEVTADTETSDFDTEIGIYDNLGNLIGNDDDGGTGTLSSFTALGLPAGTYYIAAGGFNTTFASGYDVSSSSTAVGSLVINASTPAPPAPATVASLSLTGCSDSDSYSAAYDGAADGVVWLELTYDGGCTEATFDTLLSDFDTEIGVYDSNGFLIANNDDFGSPQSSITEAGLPAGTYYIALGGFNTTYSDGFDATTSNSLTGNLEFVASTPGLSCAPVIIDTADVVDSCNPDGTGTFTVEIVVTDAGDAGSVFDDGTATYPVVAGLNTLGTYNTGDSVTIEIVALDAACNDTVGTFSFTCPLAQDNCDTAEAITPGTYTTTITQGSGGSIMGTGGDSAFFVYTPAEDGEIYVNSCDGGADTFLNIGTGPCIDLTSIASNDDSCASGLGNNFASELTIPVTAGTPYTIEWDDRYASGANEFTWTLEFIPPPACTLATIDSSTVVDDCNPDGTGSFTVEILVSDAGSAGSVFDDGTTTYAVVAGTVTAGPYNSGDSVTIELIALDEACSFTVGTFEFTCPPPAPENDEIAGAIDLPVGDTLCETIVAGTNVGATDSIENDNEASCSTSDPAGDVWFKVMVPSTGELTIEVSASTTDPIITDTVMEVYTGVSGALVEIACSDDDGDGLLSLVELTGLTPGEVLLVRVWEWQDNFKGNFNICAWSPTTLGVDDNTFEGFTYFPNPVKDVLTLDSPRAIDSVEIFNMLGQRIIAVDSQNTIQNIDMSNIQSGAYIVKVSIGDQTKAIRVIKE